MDRNVHDLPAGMVSIGDALQGLLTDLEERCEQNERGKRGKDPNYQAESRCA